MSDKSTTNAHAFLMFDVDSNQVPTNIKRTALLSATNLTSGVIRPDNTTTFVNASGVLSAVSSGGGGSVTAVTSSINALTFSSPTLTPTLTTQNVTSPTTQFLRGDGTWAIPAAPQTGLTSVGLQAPAAFTVGNTPLTANGNLVLAWSTAPAGLVPVANLGTGTPSNSTYLRGDATWASIPSFSGVTSINGISAAVVLGSPKSDISIQLSAQNINLGVNTSKITETLNAASATAGALTVDVSNNSAFTLSNLSGNTTLLVNGIASVLTVNNQTFVFTIISNQAAATNYISNVTVTGSTINLRWLNNTTPTAGSASGGRDVYRFTFIKTGLTSYDVLATQGRY